MRTAWAATRQVLTGGLTGLASIGVLVALAVATVLIPVGIGLPLLRPAARLARTLVGYEHRRATRYLHQEEDEEEAEPGPLDPRRLGWLGLHPIAGIPFAAGVLLLWLVAAGVVVVPALWWGVPGGRPLTFVVPITTWSHALLVPPLLTAGALAVLRWGVPVLALAQARLNRALLAPGPGQSLARRVAELSESRAGALDAHAAELRRIERDLHDGTQARLVAIAIQLGVAQSRRAADPALADQLVGRARSGVEDALTELRAVVRGIYPPILADRGLSGAVHALAAACPVPLTLRIAPLGRLPAAVESAAYFVIAEALTNVARHSGASGAELHLEHPGDRLVVRLAEDGVGGADERRGTGLAGIRQRVAALDGRTELSSPPGGPTVLRVELPCVS
ncbi:sensor histidine kinase [Micromonospora sp. NBC_01796]|uniref:sensor histidine kinase n=1 Tax=Micromonospora sp. NBC_01796 TaxID=2975987 RepID=UPI002DD7C91B|nr:histidine kinase [Micromonospora sp. NBC_01796]WSA83376.1 histidine kinase [Micromonospora sp. NBC_01796]